jgi:hypothetical protein
MRLIKLAAGTAAAAALVAALAAFMGPIGRQAAPAAIIGQGPALVDDSGIDSDPAPYKVGKRRSIPSPPAPVEPADGPLTTFVNRRDGYRLRVPATWRWHVVDAVGAPPAISFQIPTASGSAGRFAIGISIGTEAGWITLCRPECAAVRTRTIVALERILDSVPDLPIRDSARAIRLGGERGRLEFPGPTRYTLCFPDAMYHAFTIHDGRPVVLRLNYCRMQSHELKERGEPNDLMTRMLASFRFLD